MAGADTRDEGQPEPDDVHGDIEPAPIHRPSLADDLRVAKAPGSNAPRARAQNRRYTLVSPESGNPLSDDEVFQTLREAHKRGGLTAMQEEIDRLVNEGKVKLTDEPW